MNQKTLQLSEDSLQRTTMMFGQNMMYSSDINYRPNKKIKNKENNGVHYTDSERTTSSNIKNKKLDNENKSNELSEIETKMLKADKL